MTDIMPYIASLIGFLVVYVLNSIKQEIRDIKTSLTTLEADLHTGVSSLDRRITIIETRYESHQRQDRV